MATGCFDFNTGDSDDQILAYCPTINVCEDIFLVRYLVDGNTKYKFMVGLTNGESQYAVKRFDNFSDALADFANLVHRMNGSL